MDTQVPPAALRRVTAVALTAQTAGYGEWTLQDGQLQFMRTSGRNEQTGFRWNGEKFVPVSSQRNAQVDDDTALSSDDEEEDDGWPGFLTPAACKAFKAAGWHYRHLTGYETKAMQATQPITLSKNSFDLTVTKLPMSESDELRFDLMAVGVKSVEISRNGQQTSTQALWNLKGMQTVSIRPTGKSSVCGSGWSF
jgi:hypothetical protein